MSNWLRQANCNDIMKQRWQRMHSVAAWKSRPGVTWHIDSLCICLYYLKIHNLQIFLWVKDKLSPWLANITKIVFQPWGWYVTLDTAMRLVPNKRRATLIIRTFFCLQGDAYLSLFYITTLTKIEISDFFCYINVVKSRLNHSESHRGRTKTYSYLCQNLDPTEMGHLMNIFTLSLR